MTSMVKMVLWTALGLAAAPIIALAAYDMVVFQPHLPALRRLIAQAAPEERSPPATLLRVVRAAHADHLTQLLPRLLQHELNAEPQGRQLRRHASAVAWWLLVALHLDETEQMTLYLSLSRMGAEVKGFAQAAPRMTGGPLSEVSVAQAARLVVVAKSPGFFLNSPERLARHAEALARQAENEP